MSTMTLSLPMNYVEIDRDEMEYVDGGLYISNAQIRNTVSAFGFANRSNVGALAAALTPVIPLATSWINSLPIVGQAIFAAICVTAGMVAYQFAYAYFTDKGVNITLKSTGIYTQVM